MLHVLLWIHVLVQVWCEDLPPPQDVHIDSLLRWSPDAEHRHVTYTAQYLSFDTERWKNVPSCVQTNLTSCDVTAIKANAEHGCVGLRVRAEKYGLTSRPVEACGEQGDACSPRFSVIPGQGLLTVELSRNNSMSKAYAAHYKHIVYFGKKGEKLKEFKEAISSVNIKDLEEGGQYCVKVQFILYSKPLGPPSCAQCAVIPGSEKTNDITIAIVTVVMVFIAVALIVAYILIFQHERIKQFLRPPYQMPKYLSEPLPSLKQSISNDDVEHYDQISFIVREDELDQRA
ncbi:interleukin-20 receptor subunit alpha-like [Polymixia lowei]